MDDSFQFLITSLSLTWFNGSDLLLGGAQPSLNSVMLMNTYSLGSSGKLGLMAQTSSYTLCQPYVKFTFNSFK